MQQSGNGWFLPRRHISTVTHSVLLSDLLDSSSCCPGTCLGITLSLSAKTSSLSVLQSEISDYHNYHCSPFAGLSQPLLCGPRCAWLALLLDKEVQELVKHNGTMSSSLCRVIAALLFPCLQLQSICPVIEEEDLCLPHVLGDPDLAALQEMTRM